MAVHVGCEQLPLWHTANESRTKSESMFPIFDTDYFFYPITEYVCLISL